MKLSRKQKKKLQKQQNQVLELKESEIVPDADEPTQVSPVRISEEPDPAPVPSPSSLEKDSAPQSSSQAVNSHSHKPESPQSFFTNWKLSLLVFLVFPAITFAIYSNALDSNFVFDDEVNIEMVKSLKMTEFNLQSLVQAGTDGFLKKRPLANVTFAINYYFGQLETRGYHIVNISIHALNGIIIYFLFRTLLQTPVMRRRYDPQRFVPLAASMIWLVHPVQVQSVTYIVQRMNSMASMFYFLGVLCYLRARLALSPKTRVILFALCLLSAGLGLATKEIVASIPFAIILVEWTCFQNFSLQMFKKWLPALGGLLVAFFCIAFWALGRNPFDFSQFTAPYEPLPYNMGQRVITEFRVVLFYLKQLFVAHPSLLNILHGVTPSTSLLNPITTLFSFIAIMASMIGAAFTARKAPLIFLAVFWYFGTLVIESSIINLELIYEHRSYLPSIFVILAVVTYLSKIIPFVMLRRGLFVAVVCLLCFWTYSRNAVWADEIVLWQDTINKNPMASRAYNDLANAYAMKGEKRKAVKIYYEGMHLNYNDWKMHYNLAVILDSLWETDKAIEQFKWVIRAKPKFAEAHFRLGMIYARNKEYQKAVWHTKEAIRLQPDMTTARKNLVSYEKWAKHGRP